LIVPGLIFAAVVAVGLIVVLAPASTSHRLWVEVPDANGLYAGEAIREAGIDVGGVASVQPAAGGHRARVGLTFHSRAWPIDRGVRLSLRWGGTISYLNYYLDLVAPRRPGDPYGDGAMLAASAPCSSTAGAPCPPPAPGCRRRWRVRRRHSVRPTCCSAP
jgi:ABC-type transporter Mla subunit MlaD